MGKSTDTGKSVQLAHGTATFLSWDNPTFSFDPDSQPSFTVDRIFGFDFTEKGEEDLDPTPCATSSGYGQSSVFCIPISHADDVEQALVQSIDNFMNNLPVYQEQVLEPNTGQWRAILKREKDCLWIFIQDGTALCFNFEHILAGTPWCRESFNFDRELEIQNDKFQALSGDENSDDGFSEWLEEFSPKTHQRFVDNGWLKNEPDPKFQP